MTASLVPLELLNPIVAYFHPRRVILFGSQAMGDAGPDSDIDLLVELDDDFPQEKLSTQAVQKAQGDYSEPVDILTYRTSVLADRARAIGSFAYIVLRDGVTVYERS